MRRNGEWFWKTGIGRITSLCVLAAFVCSGLLGFRSVVIWAQDRETAGRVGVEERAENRAAIVQNREDIDVIAHWARTHDALEKLRHVCQTITASPPPEKCKGLY